MQKMLGKLVLAIETVGDEILVTQSVAKKWALRKMKRILRITFLILRGKPIKKKMVPQIVPAIQEQVI